MSKKSDELDIPDWYLDIQGTQFTKEELDKWTAFLQFGKFIDFYERRNYERVEVEISYLKEIFQAMRSIIRKENEAKP